MLVVSSSREFRAYASAHEQGCVLVPTMGALHDGHTALVRQGVQAARDRHLSAGCVVTIFVNPTQFNDPADYERYPQTLNADLERCRRAGAACVLAPSVDDIYPPGSPVPVPALPAVATEPRLEDAFRPGHFAGVCQVVRRLCDLTRPAAAVFGEKDWQQLRVVAAMVASGPQPIDIIPAPTVRAPSGLALSSRNRFILPQDQPKADGLRRAFEVASQARSWRAAEAAAHDTLLQLGAQVEYAAIRDPDTLAPLPQDARQGRILWAVRLGPVRLIDNAPWHAHA